MIKNNYKLIIPIAFSLLILFSCSQNKVEPPKRLKGIPKSAFWSGGLDGGYWYDLKKLSDRIYYFTIYHDYNLIIIYRGKFRLVGKSHSIKQIKNDMDGYYGGKKIMLNNGNYLIKIR